MNLLNSNKDTFTLRQTMERPDFECYHYLDPVPPAVDFHEHEFYEVFFFLSGDVNYIIEGRTYQLRPGDILLTDNRDIHKPDIRPGKPYERFVIWIDPDFLHARARPAPTSPAVLPMRAKKSTSASVRRAARSPTCAVSAKKCCAPVMTTRSAAARWPIYI